MAIKLSWKRLFNIPRNCCRNQFSTPKFSRNVGQALEANLRSFSAKWNEQAAVLRTWVWDNLPIAQDKKEVNLGTNQKLKWNKSSG